MKKFFVFALVIAMLALSVSAVSEIALTFSTDTVCDAGIFPDGATYNTGMTAENYGDKLGFGMASAGETFVFQKHPLGDVQIEGSDYPWCRLIEGKAEDYTLVFDLYIDNVSNIDGAASFTKLFAGDNVNQAISGNWSVTFENLVSGWNTIEVPLTNDYFTGELNVADLDSFYVSAFNVTLINTAEIVAAIADVKLVSDNVEATEETTAEETTAEDTMAEETTPEETTAEKKEEAPQTNDSVTVAVVVALIALAATSAIVFKKSRAV